MKLAKWDDGYILDADPRREDPLYYYMKEGGWGSALGIEVDPLYEEFTASSVSIRVRPEHLPREAGMSAKERFEMYPRVVSVLLARFPKWSQVTLQSSHLPELLEQNSLPAVFTAAGFSPSMTLAPNENTWTKA
jgi:hypothetical protein